jgi:hypothetical protein
MSHCRLGGGGTRDVRVRVVMLKYFFQNQEVVRFRWWVNRQRSLLSDCEFLLLRGPVHALDWALSRSGSV